MIALVGVLPPSEATAGLEVLDRLPPAETAVHPAWLVGCRTCGEIEGALAWYARLRQTRPTTSLGLVCALDTCAPLVAAQPYTIRPVLAGDTLVEGRVPIWALAELRATSLIGRLLDELVCEHGAAVLAQRPLLEVLVARGIRGGTVEGAAQALRRDPDTIRRVLSRVDLRPCRLMARMRLRAYDLMVDGGDAPSRALAACGWTNAKARDKFRARWR